MRLSIWFLFMSITSPGFARLASDLPFAFAKPTFVTKCDDPPLESPSIITPRALDASHNAQSRPSWLPGEFKVSGLVNLDAIHDFDAIGETDRFDTRTIFTDGREGANTRLHARSTRLGIEWQRSLEIGHLRTYVESDFFGRDSQLRIRHAYAELDQWLLGQTWSTFIDARVLPEVLDFENPTGALNLRRPMVRWSHALNNTVGLAFAIEDPAPTSTILAPSGIGGRPESPYPDLTSRLHLSLNRAELQAASFVGVASFQGLNGFRDDATVWGLNFTGIINLRQADKLKFQYAFGDGLPRFRGVTAVAPTASLGIDSSYATAWLVALEHDWSNYFSSTLVYSTRQRDSLAGEPMDANVENEYASINLLWKPSLHTRFGIEYLFGTKEAKDGATGEANRLMLACRVFFP